MSPAPRVRRAFVLLLRTAVSITLVAVLLGRLDTSRFGELVGEANPPALAAGLLAYASGFLFAARRWSLLLHGLGVRLPPARAIRLYLVGQFYNMLLPGAIGGDAARAGMGWRETGRPVAALAFSVVFERAFGLLALTVILCAGLPALPPAMRARLGARPGWVVPLVAAAALAAAFALRRRLRSRPPGPPDAGWRARLLEVAGAAARLRKRDLAAALGWSLAFQGADLAATRALASAIGLDLPLAVLCVAVPLVYIATILPISLGGLGLREGTLVYALGLAGVPASDAITLSLLVYAVRVAVGLAGGVLHLRWRTPVPR